MIAAAVALAGLGWRRLRQDPLALAFTLLVPVAMTSVMVGIYTAAGPGTQTPVAVVMAEDGPVSRALLSRLRADPLLDVDVYADRAAMERAVRRRDVAAGIVVPAAAEHTWQGDGRTDPARIELVGPPELAVPGGVRTTVEAAVAHTAAALQLGQALVPDGSPAGALAVGQIGLAPAASGGRPEVPETGWWDGLAEAAVLGILVLFVGTNTMGGSMALAELRELGVLARARTTRASPGSVALGFGLWLTSYALFQAVLVLVTSRVLFGVTWVSLGAMAVVLVALSLVAGGLGVVTGTLLPSPESGSTIAGPAGFVLGMLGGCLWPLDLVGPTLDRIGHLTPQAWAIDALQATGMDGGGLGDVVVPLVVLGTMAAGLLVVGSWRVARIAAHA